MALGELTVVDVHHHVGTLAAHDSREARYTGLAGPPGDGAHGAEVELAMRLDEMDALGVDQAVVIPSHSYLRPRGALDTMAVNDAIAAYRDRMPDRFPAALGIVEPMHGDASLDELVRIKDELGLVGVSFHVRFQGCSTDSPLVWKLVHRMAELDLVPFVHAVGYVPDEAIWRQARLARSIPDTPVVVLDTFSTSESARQTLQVAEDTPNLVFDTGMTDEFSRVRMLVDAIGPERVLFGTDNYSKFTPAPLPTRHGVLEGLAASDLSVDAKRAILGANASRLLGLERHRATTRSTAR